MANFPPSPWWIFSSKPLKDTILTRSPSSSHKGSLTPTWARPFPNSVLTLVLAPIAIYICKIGALYVIKRRKMSNTY
jgi:hypothetical protein